MPHQRQDGRTKKKGGAMKTRFGMMALVVAAVVSLSGCMTPLTRNQLAERFDTGENIIYLHVKGVNKNISQAPCPRKIEDRLSENGKKVFADKLCKNLGNLQLVAGFYWTHPTKGIQTLSGYSPSNMDIQRDDIVKVSIPIAADGAIDGPATVVSVARKAKDVSKESGCYWEGGAMFTNAFRSGGIVCDGWDWKKQKFAQ